MCEYLRLKHGRLQVHMLHSVSVFPEYNVQNILHESLLITKFIQSSNYTQKLLPAFMAICCICVMLCKYTDVYLLSAEHRIHLHHAELIQIL